MSAWIVDDITINRIVTLISKGYWQMLKDLGYWYNEYDLGKDMIKMNCKAVSQRYDEPIDKKRIEAYRLKTEPTTIIQAFKSLNCFLYQCMEGSVPKMKLYITLRKIEDAIAHDIVAGLPEYDKAEWG